MRPYKSNLQRRPLWKNVLIFTLVLVVGGAGTVGALAGLKVIDPNSLAFWRPRVAPIPKGWIPVPLSPRAIPAYTMVTRNHLWDPKSNNYLVDWMPPERVPKGVLTKLAKIRGRVTKREKPAGYAFTEDDFYPEGTTPGIGAGTPPGKRAITLEAGKLEGVHDLKEGDHLDLLASIPVDMPGSGHSNSSHLTSVVTSPDGSMLPKRSMTKPLVEDGVVVVPVRIRNAPTTSSSLSQGRVTRSMPIQEVIIAVEPEEVAPLAEAMDMKYRITCVARSGRAVPHTQSKPLPAAAAASPVVAAPAKAPATNAAAKETSAAAAAPAKPDITPGYDPRGEVESIVVMVGKQSQLVVFNGPDHGPVVAATTDNSAKPASAVVPATGAVEEKPAAGAADAKEDE